MYTLYWNPAASSLAPMAVLEEAGVPYGLHRVDSDGGECDSPGYRKVQPLGLIPALRLPDDSTIFESAAIVQFLSDRHASGTLAPAVDEPDRPRYLQWLHYMAGTIYPTYNRYFWPARYSASPEGLDEIRSHVGEIVLAQWQVVEDSLERDGPWLLGERFCAGDIYLQMMTTWHKSPAELLYRFPRIRELAKAVLARDACQTAFQKHAFKSGFEPSS